MLPYLNDDAHAKSLRYQLIPSRDNDDQKTPKSDCTRGTPGSTQAKVVVTDATLP